MTLILPNGFWSICRWRSVCLLHFLPILANWDVVSCLIALIWTQLLVIILPSIPGGGEREIANGSNSRSHKQWLEHSDPSAPTFRIFQIGIFCEENKLLVERTGRGAVSLLRSPSVISDTYWSQSSVEPGDSDDWSLFTVNSSGRTHQQHHLLVSQSSIPGSSHQCLLINNISTSVVFSMTTEESCDTQDVLQRYVSFLVLVSVTTKHFWKHFVAFIFQRKHYLNDNFSI